MFSTLARMRLFATVMAIAVFAAACGGGTTATSPTPTTAATAAATTAAPGVLPKPELNKIRIGLSAPTEPVQFSEKLADMLGYYKEYGLTAEIIGFEGDGKALQALIAGQLDLFVGGASTAVNSVITDTPVKVVAMNSVLNTDGLFCKSAIKVAADVKGRAVAISTFGGTSHGSALLSLQGLGLKPSEAVITQVGNEGTRIAALKGGSIDCAVASMQLAPDLKALGFNVLIDITHSGGQWGRSGLMARTDFLAKNPNTVLNIVAAVVRAQNQMYVDPKTASTNFATYTQQKPADADKAIAAFPGYGLRSMIFTQEAFVSPRDVLATVNPAVTNVDVTKAFDLSYLNKLKDNGFYAKYSIPLQ